MEILFQIMDLHEALLSVKLKGSYKFYFVEALVEFLKCSNEQYNSYHNLYLKQLVRFYMFYAMQVTMIKHS